MLLTFAPGYRLALFFVLLTFAPTMANTAKATWGIFQSESVSCDLTRKATNSEKKAGGHLPRSPLRVRIYTSSPGSREYP